LVDVTSQRDSAELLALTNEHLERLVRERTSALEEANALMGLEIAERRRAEGEAARATERYRVLVEHMPAVAYIWRTANHDDEADADYYISPRIEEVLGYTPDEWHDQACWIERLHPHDRDEVVATMLRCEETGEPFAMEYRYLAKDGRVVWIEDHASLLSRTPDGRPALFHGVMLDVTARKTAESQAVEARRRYRQLTEEGPFATYTAGVDPDDPTALRLDYVSPQMGAVVGHEATTRLERAPTWFDLLHPDDRDRVNEQLVIQLRSGGPSVSDYRVIAVDGRVVWLRDHRRCVEHDDLGRPLRFLGTIVDVTDEIEERERSRDELDRLRTIIDRIPAVTWIQSVAPDGTDPRYLYMSPQVEQLLGYSAEELLAERMHFPRMVHGDDEDRIGRSWRLACLSGAASWQDRWRVRHRDGTYRWIDARATRVSEPDAPITIWVGFSVDATTEMTSEPSSPGAGSP
jgi:PAS domain S-box-containing protein